MQTLREKLQKDSSFLIGVELLSTRAILGAEQGVRARTLATQLAQFERVDWVSITDNAGGNPTLSPVALGKPLLYAGKEVVIHLSCKDFNRNGLESVALQLGSEGFHNILALSGDYPVKAFEGGAKPVFDIDSVGLLTLLRSIHRDHGAQFLTGAVATNFKLHENEVVPQYLKLEKKLDAGAEFIITQIGFDSRKCDELLAYLESRGREGVPLIGNVFLLSARVARYFRTGKIPGVLLPDTLFEECERQASSADQGKAFFHEFAAKQIAVLRGLGYRGAYLGGVKTVTELESILAIERSFAENDWREFAREIRHSRVGEFFYFPEEPKTGLSARQRAPETSASAPRGRLPFFEGLRYRFSKRVHGWAFTPGTRLFRFGKRLYASSRNPKQGPLPLRVVEHASKSLLFNCKDCGDCSLPDMAFLCPESACAKNQRNGPCGGTRDGKCEVDDFECVWSRAYDRLKSEARQDQLLDHAPVVQDQSLRGTSSWGNSFLGQDHHGRWQAPPVSPVAFHGESGGLKVKHGESPEEQAT